MTGRITDVPGVRVGHATILEGDSIRTGVTAILPHGGNLFHEKVPAAFFVGNDSGPAHIAAAFGKPCAVIFGSSNSKVWGPWKTPSRVIETSWECKPCPGDRCYAFDQPRCILSIEEASVASAVDALLQTS